MLLVLYEVTAAMFGCACAQGSSQQNRLSQPCSQVSLAPQGRPGENPGS